MKRFIVPLLIVFGFFVTSSCLTKTISPQYLNGSWYVFEDMTTEYTFVNDTIMYIDEEYEGDEYKYLIKGDTIIYHLIGDDYNNNQRLYLEVGGANTMFASDGNTGFILRRKEKP